MSERKRNVTLAEVPEMIADLTAVLCLAPCFEQPSGSVRRDARELAAAIRRIKSDLDDFLTDEVRNDLEQLLQHIDRNRDRYRDAVLLWIDLLEEISALMEGEYGDKTGPLKNRKVRAAMYYLMKGFVGKQELPNVPPFLRPIVLEVAIRWTVEFLVALDNKQCDRPELWEGISPEKPRGELLKMDVRFTATWDRWMELLGTWIVGWFLKPPKLDGKLRVKVDAILQRWHERNMETDTTPVERTVGVVFRTVRWVGDHANEMRALVDLLTVAVVEAAKLSRLSRNERIAVVKEAMVILIQDDLGLTGPLWGEIIRVMVDIMADSIEDLFSKRGHLAA